MGYGRLEKSGNQHSTRRLSESNVRGYAICPTGLLVHRLRFKHVGGCSSPSIASLSPCQCFLHLPAFRFSRSMYSRTLRSSAESFTERVNWIHDLACHLTPFHAKFALFAPIFSLDFKSSRSDIGGDGDSMGFVSCEEYRGGALGWKRDL